MSAPRRISIFGATGSIGESAFDLISAEPDRFEVLALTGAQNIERLAEQAIALKAEIAVTADEALLGELRARLDGTGIKSAAGRSSIIEAAERPADWVLSGIVGIAGLEPGLVALRQGATLALANKESLVSAGPLLMRTANDHGATVLPVDSEHSAIFQALLGEEISAVESVVITASGGAFRDWPEKKLANVTLAEASTHPNWSMGQRITIDSASLFNKAMELIETKEFFGLTPDVISAVIHPESLVHALVGFRDGAIMAHLGAPDMRHAIGFALNWPERRELPVDRLDLAEIGQLNFMRPDEGRYPAIRLAREVMEQGGLSGAVFTAAKDAALDAFIANEIGFTDMARLVEETFAQQEIANSLVSADFSLDNVMAMDHLARTVTKRQITKLSG